MAGGDDLAIFDYAPVRSAVGLRLDASGRNALCAVGTLFHHAAAADGDFGVLDQPHQFVVCLTEAAGVAEEVEPSHFERAVVGTVPRADAAVIDHVVEPLVGVNRRGDGAYLLAGSRFAVLARDRLVGDLRVGEIDLLAPLAIGHLMTAEVTIDADPVHLATARHLVLADHRHIVFCRTGDDARIAAEALVEVDRHPPRPAIA